MTPHAYYNEHAAYPADRLEDLIREGLIPYGTVDRRDIQDVQPEDLAGFTQCHFFAGIGGWAYACRLAGWPDDRPIWTGSCPCQPFSVAGRGRGTADARHLWPDFLRLIRACRPPVVVGEQVAGAAGTAWFSGVRADLAAEAYAVRGVDVTAYAIGAPHERQRLYWLGHANRPREQQPKGHIGDIRGRTGNTDAPRRMEHAAGIGRREGWPEQQGRIGVLSPASADAQSGMGNAVRTRSPISEAKSGGMGPEDGRCTGYSTQRPDDPGFWAHTETIWCEWDQKWRRSKPEISWLVDGLPGRVGAFAAYGNAVIPQIAAEVIASYLETDGWGILP